MKKPTLKKFEKFTKLSQYPQGTYFEAGYLTQINAGWRVEKPVVDIEKCKNCLICYMYCPDGVIERKENCVAIDYNFCKGCGICKKVCPFHAMEMEAE